jgi:putative ABC transport system permease protein
MTFNYGIITENLVNVSIQDVNYGVFSNEIIKNSNINGISLSNEVPIHGGLNALNLKNENMEEPRNTFYYSVNPGFINNFNIELIAGRNFSDDFSTDTMTSIIINQEALRVFDLGSPVESIGKTLIAGDNLEVEVIGVVKNFNYTFPDVPVDPLVLRYRPEEFRYVNISYVPGKKDEIKTYLQNAWKKFDKVHDVEYIFFDDAQQESDTKISGIIRIFSWVSGFIILIALFGLLGMTSYSTEMRIKEIGIRKVFGASVFNAGYQLSKDYIKLILYSAVIALPAAYFLSATLYQFFAFRPALSLWVLPASLIFILILAMITISSQTIKASLANPAETLKEG